MPPATVVVPENAVLTPFSVSVPAPCLTRPPVPTRLPPKVCDESSDSVSALPPSTTRLPVTPDRCATVWLPAADRSSAAVEPASVTDVDDASWPAPDNASVPASTIVAPV